MKRTRICSALICLALLISLIPSARAAALTRPSWCPEEEYVVFQGSAAYDGENAKKLLALQEHAAAGNLAPQSGTDTTLY
ncbi:MAG: hypothetical protein PUC36_07510, partial [Clostridiales bacterium]|nr:hypothetical protein [Clostridiales bacterium]